MDSPLHSHGGGAVYLMPDPCHATENPNQELTCARVTRLGRERYVFDNQRPFLALGLNTSSLMSNMRCKHQYSVS